MVLALNHVVNQTKLSLFISPKMAFRFLLRKVREIWALDFDPDSLCKQGNFEYDLHIYLLKKSPSLFAHTKAFHFRMQQTKLRYIHVA
jgi:hypothetical protein